MSLQRKYQISEIYKEFFEQGIIILYEGISEYLLVTMLDSAFDASKAAMAAIRAACSNMC